MIREIIGAARRRKRTPTGTRRPGRCRRKRLAMRDAAVKNENRILALIRDSRPG